VTNIELRDLFLDVVLQQIAISFLEASRKLSQPLVKKPLIEDLANANTTS
jgi:hypothetical protein